MPSGVHLKKPKNSCERRCLSISKVSQCLQNYGTILANLQRLEEAVISFNNAIKLTPGRAPIYSDLGIALHKLKRYDEAIAVYDKIYHLNLILLVSKALAFMQKCNFVIGAILTPNARIWFHLLGGERGIRYRFKFSLFIQRLTTSSDALDSMSKKHFLFLKNQSGGGNDTIIKKFASRTCC